MSAQDNLSPDQFTDVYHATDPRRAKSIMNSRSFRGVSVYGGNQPDSPYLTEFGPARVHLRVPSSIVHPDPAWENEHAALTEMNSNSAGQDGEEHYHLNAKDVKPHHIVGATGLHAWD